LNVNRLPASISEALESGATLICATAQRQAAIRAAFAELQRSSGRALWRTPRVFTFAQFAEKALDESWARAGLPDRLLPPGAEWSALREWRREAGGTSEARALLQSVRRLRDWRIPRAGNTLLGTPEGELLLEAIGRLDSLHADRKPLREWLPELAVPDQKIAACGVSALAAAPRDALRRWGASVFDPVAAPGSVNVCAAETDAHELELIAAWCREQLEADSGRRLLIVDARLRQRRGLYDRVLSQALAPSEWLDRQARPPSRVFAFEGGRPFAEFPLVAHALSSLRLLTGRLRFDEVVHWLRLPFLDAADGFAGAAVESVLRSGRKLEMTGEELASSLERATVHAAVAGFAQRLRQAGALLDGGKRSPSEWSPRLLAALRAVGWHGSRALRSDEQQTVARWHLLLDEFAALGSWLPRGTAADAVATLADLAAERNFDPESVAAPVTLTDSHDDPVIRYDAIWVAGLDASQWPASPRPDVFIPLRLQVQAGIPWASALGQTQAAHRSLGAWRAATASLTCSWARLEGDAHRTSSPLLARLEQTTQVTPRAREPLAASLRQIPTESVDDARGLPVDTRVVVPGGVTPLALQAECGFHAYAQVRLAAAPLEEPAPGIDARHRGMLLHKALELVWIKLKDFFHLVGESNLRMPLISDSVEAAVVAVFRGHVPHELRAAVEREKWRLERLIASLLEVEAKRAPFTVEACERECELHIGGGRFRTRIDRIDSIEGGGFAILDYKSGESRAPRWQGEQVRDPQLLAYAMAEAGRNVQALANVCLANGRAKFRGKASRSGLLPDIKGMPEDEANDAWHADLESWLRGLAHLAARYIAGDAPVQPASDVCRHCHLTILCRRVELQGAELEADDMESP
jgi:ATP-dependent helicase/nuclease subunit B